MLLFSLQAFPSVQPLTPLSQFALSCTRVAFLQSRASWFPFSSSKLPLLLVKLLVNNCLQVSGFFIFPASLQPCTLFVCTLGLPLLLNVFSQVSQLLGPDSCHLHNHWLLLKFWLLHKFWLLLAQQTLHALHALGTGGLDLAVVGLKLQLACPQLACLHQVWLQLDLNWFGLLAGCFFATFF